MLMRPENNSVLLLDFQFNVYSSLKKNLFLWRYFCTVKICQPKLKNICNYNELNLASIVESLFQFSEIFFEDWQAGKP